MLEASNHGRPPTSKSDSSSTRIKVVSLSTSTLSGYSYASYFMLMHSTTATSLTSGYRGVRGSYDVTKRRSLTSFGVQQPRDRGLCSSMSPISTRCDLFLGLEGIVASKTSSFQSSLTLKKSVAVVRGLFGGSLDHKTSLRYQVFEIVVDHQPRVDYYLLPAYKVTAMLCIY